jgi:signal transduction histidine kinase
MTRWVNDVDDQKLRSRVAIAKAAERRRLQQDMHDMLIPMLHIQTLDIGTAIALLDTNLDEARRILQQVERKMPEITEEIRRLLDDLRPKALEHDLRDVLRSVVDEHQHANCSISLLVQPTLPTLDEAVEEAIYFITREALSNVVRHARASHCQITLAFHDLLTLTIVDDGVGIPPTYTPGVGLGSMRERVTALGGTFALKRNEGSGTCIEVMLPAAREEDET